MKLTILLLTGLTLLSSCRSSRPELSPDLTAEEKAELLKALVLKERMQLTVRQNKYGCHTEVSKLAGSSHFNVRADIFKNQSHCDAWSAELIPMMNTGVKALLAYEALPFDKMTIQFSTPGQSFIKSWAALLKDHPQWKNRPRTRSENALVEELLLKEGMLKGYYPLFQEINFHPTEVSIGKLSYLAPTDDEDLTNELEALGFSSQNKVPLPSSIQIKLQPK